MARQIVLFLLIGLIPVTGKWVTKTGDIVDKPCPNVLEMTDKARLPRGCIAHQAGVWLSRQTYTDYEVSLVSKDQTISILEAKEIAFKKRIEDLETQLKIEIVTPPPPTCTKPILLTTSLAGGACAAWILSQSR